MISHTLNAWATAMGIDQQTLERDLIKAGFDKPKDGWGKVSFKKIIAACMGEEQREKIRGLRLDNEERERKAAEEAGELVRMADVGQLLTETIITPLGNALDSVPTTYDTRCNPTDPELARQALVQMREDLKRILRDGMPVKETE